VTNLSLHEEVETCNISVQFIAQALPLLYSMNEHLEIPVVSSVSFAVQLILWGCSFLLGAPLLDSTKPPLTIYRNAHFIFMIRQKINKTVNLWSVLD
jgi:hypothetical protein